MMDGYIAAHPARSVIEGVEMSGRVMRFAVLCATLATVAPAAAASAQTVTATGTSQVAVKPADRNSNASIAAAVEAARTAGISGAIDDAKKYAGLYASATGLTLGSVVSVTDAQPSNFGPFSGGGFYGPFGPNRYCGTVTRGVVKVVNGRKRVVKTKKVHRCFVPAFETTTLTVTYSAT
jgi:hypothetical protein